MSLTVSDWVKERLENCKRIAATKKGEDRAGWLEDAKYFAEIYAIVSAPEAQKPPAAEPGRYDMAVKFWLEYRMDRNLPMFNELPVDTQLYAQYIVGILTERAASTAPGWIAVSERLPEVGERIDVWILDDNSEIGGDRSEYDDIWEYVPSHPAWGNAENNRSGIFQVTHWRKRPLPPLAAPPAPHKET